MGVTVNGKTPAPPRVAPIWVLPGAGCVTFGMVCQSPSSSLLVAANVEKATEQQQVKRQEEDGLRGRERKGEGVDG